MREETFFMENRSGETNNTQNSAENAFDYTAADITNELPRGDMLQDPAGEPFQSTFEEEKPKKLNFFNKIAIFRISYAVTVL